METTTLARIDEEIIRQQLALSNLYAQKNSLSFVFRLPTDTLVEIFIYCARNSYHDDDYHRTRPSWLNVSYVCRHWRNIALNCPTLWSYISMMSLRWIDELLARSKKVSLKICISVPYDISFFRDFLEKVMHHIERIQELTLDLPIMTPRLTHEVYSKLSSRAPRLQYLKILASVDSPSKMSSLLFDGDTPALRTLELSDCVTPWYSLKLSGLTTLSLRYPPARFQKNVEEFLATLSCMQNLTHFELYLEYVLPGFQEFISSAALNTFQKINLLHLSRLLIEAPLSIVIAFLSCINIPSNTEVRLACLFEDDPSLDDHTLLSSILAQRFSTTTDLALSSQTIYSLVIERDMKGPRLVFSASERDYDSHVTDSKPYTDWDCNIPLQILLAAVCRPWTDEHHIISDICCSVPLTHVQSVHVVDPPNSSAFWKRILGHLQDLRYLRLSHGKMPELGSVLSLTHNCTKNQAGHADEGPNQIFAPVLEELELYDIAFAPKPLVRNTDTLVSDLQSLEDSLSTRKDPQVRLILDACNTGSYTVDEGYSEAEDD